MNIVKKVELDYFQSQYGHYFDIYHIDITPILRYESFLVHYFQK